MFRRLVTPSPIVLHLGAHRTATTAMQAMLDENAAALKGSGILVRTASRAGKSDRWLRRIANGVGDANRGRMWILRTRLRLRALAWAAGTAVVLSDENFLGDPFGSDADRLYPDARDRLLRLRDVLPGAPARIGLCVRSYDAFLPSAYAMMTTFGKFTTSYKDSTAKLLRGDGGGWPTLLEDVAWAFPATEIVVWRYEGTSARERVKSLVGREGAASLRGDAPWVNASLSAEGMDRAQTDRARTREQAYRIMAKDGGTKKFSPLDGAEAQRLRERYMSDLRFAAEYGPRNVTYFGAFAE